MSTDSTKIQVMVEWPTPSSIRALRRFLGLTGYYKKYVSNYGTLCKSLTDSLKKDSFKLNEDADKAFVDIKVAMSTTPILALSNYSKQSIVKIYISHYGIWAILMQDDRPITYFSKYLISTEVSQFMKRSTWIS